MSSSPLRLNLDAHPIYNAELMPQLQEKVETTKFRHRNWIWLISCVSSYLIRVLITLNKNHIRAEIHHKFWQFNAYPLADGTTKPKDMRKGLEASSVVPLPAFSACSWRKFALRTENFAQKSKILLACFRRIWYKNSSKTNMRADFGACALSLVQIHPCPYDNCKEKQ